MTATRPVATLAAPLVRRPALLKLPAPFFLLATAATGQPAADPAMRLGPTLRARAAFARTDGDRVWPGFGRAPFGFLLVNGDTETVLCQEPMPSGFMPDGRDPATGCLRGRRPRTGLPDNLLASMPILGPRETIVMGMPQATGRTPGEWRCTILHEHFHQYQATFPGGANRIGALGLAAGAGDGLWMLTYPFPHADPKVRAAYSAAAKALVGAIEARRTRGFLPAYDRYPAARAASAASVTPRDWRYLDFQLWKESVARWTEIRLGVVYPDAAVREAAASLAARTIERLRVPDLREQGRDIAYPLGAGEAMLMEACRAGCRRRYSRVVAMTPLLADVRASSRPRPRRPSARILPS